MIDTHLHLWDPATIQRSWLAGIPELDRPFLLGDYRSMAAAMGIAAAVHVESDVDEAELDREVREVATVMDASPMVRASVVGGRPGEPGFKAWLDRLGRCPGVVGLRRVFHGLGGDPGAFFTAGLVDDLVLLGERDLHFELCVRPDQLDTATALVDACPGTRFVLDHLGRPEVTSGVTPVWAEGLRRIADRGNVVAKLSGGRAAADRRPGERGREAVGAHRVFLRGGMDDGDLPAVSRSRVRAVRGGASRLGQQLAGVRSGGIARTLGDDDPITPRGAPRVGSSGGSRREREADLPSGLTQRDRIDAAAMRRQTGTGGVS